MKLKNVKTRYGASVSLLVRSTNPLATTATLTITADSVEAIDPKTVEFVEGVADLSLAPSETKLPIGTYKYQVAVDYSDGRKRKLPEPTKMSTALPDFIVYDSNDEVEVVS